MTLPAPQDATRVVAQNVRMLRKAHGWTAERLVEEMATCGVDWNRGVVSKLETGLRESVSVAELLGLAAALEVDLKMLLNDKLAITVTVAP